MLKIIILSVYFCCIFDVNNGAAYTLLNQDNKYDFKDFKDTTKDIKIEEVPDRNVKVNNNDELVVETNVEYHDGRNFRQSINKENKNQEDLKNNNDKSVSNDNNVDMKYDYRLNYEYDIPNGEIYSRDGVNNDVQEVNNKNKQAVVKSRNKKYVKRGAFDTMYNKFVDNIMKGKIPNVKNNTYINGYYSAHIIRKQDEQIFHDNHCNENNRNGLNYDAEWIDSGNIAKNTGYIETSTGNQFRFDKGIPHSSSPRYNNGFNGVSKRYPFENTSQNYHSLKLYASTTTSNYNYEMGNTNRRTTNYYNDQLSSDYHNIGYNSEYYKNNIINGKNTEITKEKRINGNINLINDGNTALNNGRVGANAGTIAHFGSNGLMSQYTDINSYNNGKNNINNGYFANGDYSGNYVYDNDFSHGNKQDINRDSNGTNIYDGSTSNTQVQPLNNGDNNNDFSSIEQNLRNNDNTFNRSDNYVVNDVNNGSDVNNGIEASGTTTEAMNIHKSCVFCWDSCPVGTVLSGGYCVPDDE